MKRTILSAVIFLILNSVLFAQIPPQKMTYQVVVRDANNELVVNQHVGIKVSILASMPNGLPVYEETHSVQTNHNALATVIVGTGTPTPGSVFANIDWPNDDFYLKCEIDPTGGSNYTITGTQQLVTVPYAFHSGTTSYFDFNALDNRPIGTNEGDILYWDVADSSWRVLPIGSPGQVLTAQNNGLSWVTNPNTLNSIAPTIITDSVFNINGYTMNVHATITNAGSTGIIESGVCWSNTNPSPSIGNNHTVDGSSIGGFTSFVSGLKSNTTYYVCAYATNSVGTSYGNVITITTPTHCGFITDIDGNTYNTVYIGRQCWMKENLRTKTYADGIPISGATYTVQIANSVDAHGSKSNPSSCYYYSNNDTASAAIFGLLYTWPAVMKGAGSSNSNPSGILGVCPFGWHVPSCAEWCELENFLNTGIDMNCSNTGWRGTMAKMMSKPKYWSADAGNSFFPGYWTTDSTDFNTTGFSMIPNGYRYYTSSYSTWNFSSINTNCYGQSHYHYYFATGAKTSAAYFWTSVSGTYRQFSSSQTGSYYGTGMDNSNALSVRCVKDYN